MQRGAVSAVNSDVLANVLRALPLPDHAGIAYLADDARTIQTLKKLLVSERGRDRRSVVSKPFWMPGRSGME